MDSGTPSSRTNYAACYDARRDRVVMFGGMSTDDRATATYSNETWEWDGDSWLQRFPASAPSPRGRARMTYDAARRRVVLFGGIDATVTHGDTWEWDGTAWISIAPRQSAPASGAHTMAFDELRRVAVMFGTTGTWDYGPIRPAAVEAFPATWPSPAGCVGSAGPITLQPLPWSGPWLGDGFECDFGGRPAGSFGMMVWGFGLLPVPLAVQATFGIPSGCEVLVSPFATELVLAPRYESFVLPTDPILLSLPMYVQAGFFDVGPSGLQIVTSNGLELTFGQK